MFKVFCVHSYNKVKRPLYISCILQENNWPLFCSSQTSLFCEVEMCIMLMFETLAQFIAGDLVYGFITSWCDLNCYCNIATPASFVHAAPSHSREEQRMRALWTPATQFWKHATYYFKVQVSMLFRNMLEFWTNIQFNFSSWGLWHVKNSFLM